MSSSSDSDSSDWWRDEVSDWELSESDEIEMQLGTRLHPRNKQFVDIIVPQYNDEEFSEHFRVSRGVVTYLGRLLEESEAYSHHVGPYGKVDSEEQVLIFLWFAGHQTSSFTDVADRFDISKSQLNRILTRVTKFVSELAPQVIRWPTTEEKLQSEQHFARKGMPGAIGAIDGSHVLIDKPVTDPASYINRKQSYSIQVVCDHQLRIIDVFAGYPGSVHDARSFRMSPLADNLEERCGDHYILGDSAYPCLRNLITPYKDRGHLTSSHKKFNSVHSSARVVIEHCFGLLKQKFRQLYHVKLRKVPNVVHFIRACCVLHNLSLTENLPDSEGPQPDPNHDLSPTGGSAAADARDDPHGQAARDRIRLSMV